jgi:serine/threonine protein kinase
VTSTRPAIPARAHLRRGAMDVPDQPDDDAQRRHDGEFLPHTMTDTDETTLAPIGGIVGKSKEVIDFGLLAVRNGMLKLDQLHECTSYQKEQEEQGRRLALEQVVVDKGFMTSLEVKAVKKAQEKQSRRSETDAVHIPGYEITGVLGEGGLGVVYKAKQVTMNRLVALKVLHLHWIADDEFRKRFILEARIVGRLSHQNLIQVYDVGKASDHYYFAMEYVAGRTCEQIVEEDGPFTIPEAVEIVTQIMRSIRYYRDFDIVHRDIKPSNIIVTRQGVAKLGDFGFVKSKIDRELGYEGMVLGTPDYISPEQALGEEHIDWRSDLYSLGATMYHMVAGVPPFEGSGSAVMLKHVREAPPSPREFNSKLSDDVVHVISKMMEKKPEDRYPTFELLFEDLELLRAGRSPSSPRVEVGKSTIFRAYKIEQSRLALLADQKRKLEISVARSEDIQRRLTWGLIGASVLAVIMSVLFILAVNGAL